MTVTINKLQILRGTPTTFALGALSFGTTTEDGVVVSSAQDVRRVMCDQVKGPLDCDLINREVTIQATLLETNIANLHAALNLATASLSDSSLTIDDSKAAKAALTLVGVAPNAKTRSWIFDEVAQVSNVDFASQKNDDSRLLLNFLAVYNVTASRFAIVGDSA